jgi:transposase
MELEKELEQFRQEAQRLKAGRQGGSLPFPEALRAFAVRYAAHLLEAGGTVVEAAQKLGVSAPTLYEWRKGRAAGRRQQKPPEKRAALVPVRVGERAAESAATGLQQVVLVSPSGWRVEGLSVESAAQLLGRLEC